MKVYMLTDENGKNVAVSLDPGMVMNMLISGLMDAGKIGPETMALDACGQTVIEVERQVLLDRGILGDSEVNQLDAEGFVLL
jgi:hypothetical protein